VGTDTQTETERQIELVRMLIAEGVDAIVLVPIDSRALVAPAVEAVRAGIKVVNIDIKLDEEMLRQAGVDIPFAGPDNRGAAYAVGCLMKKYLHTGDEVAIIEGLASADNARQRKEGAALVVSECGYRLVASEPANWETRDAYDAYLHIVQAHPDLRGVFCGNDAMALGVLQAMDDCGHHLPLTGFDNDAVMAPYLHSGKLVGTVDIFCSRMAVEGIDYAIGLIDGTASAKGIYATPYQVIRGK
jgi:ribose transport system substrate-binding protein